MRETVPTAGAIPCEKNQRCVQRRSVKTARLLFLRFSMVLLCYALMITGCADKAVYNPSIAGLNQKAQSLMQSGQTDQAIQRLESALDLNPQEVNTRFNLALAYQKKGDWDKAIVMLTSLSQQPGTLDVNKVYLALGQVYEAKADTQPAGQDGQPNPAARLPWYKKAVDSYRNIQPQTPDLEAHIQQLQQTLAEKF
jgi:tetratricopeptide (TPR) repeat protein